jgi:hypothetical protein
MNECLYESSEVRAEPLEIEHPEVGAMPCGERLQLFPCFAHELASAAWIAAISSADQRSALATIAP